ncbi:MAG TPA: efflux RND transporter periplasmic adaptor subunit [Polyangiaceae bacterium]
MTAIRRFRAALAALSVACHRPESGGHGHDHGHHPGPDHGEHAAQEGGAAPLAITKWTDRYELFVEFPPPKPHTRIVYHAHVTRLADFKGVAAGKFTVRFKRGEHVVAGTHVDGVKRAGIFTPVGPAPAAGRYSLEMIYEHGGQSATFDCGEVDVADEAPVGEKEAPLGEITFLKEVQWKIPFGTTSAERRELSEALEFPATVETAGTDQLALAAPTSGRFFHDRREALAVGRKVKKGEVLGSIAPNVEGEDFSRLESSVEEARIQKQHIQAELERVTPLVEQGLLPERRRIQLENELSVQQAKLTAAERRVGRVLAPGGAGGLPVRATMDGLVREVLVPNGEPVQAGSVVLRLAGTDHIWLRSRFVARPTGELADARPVAVRLGDGRRIDLKGRAAFVSAQPIVDPQSRLATWVIEVSPSAVPQTDADLRPGAAVVVVVKVGSPRKVLAIPRGTVVEISTRPYVFVQSSGEGFLKRRVETGADDGEFVEIRSGVAEGERVVTVGGFDVHIASLSGTVESHRH